MLSPPTQLEVDKFPHHKGLGEADGSQYCHPDKKNIKVSSSPVKTLILSIGKAESNGEDRQGQSEQPSKDKQDSPESKTHLSIFIAEIDQAGNVEKQFNEIVQHQENQAQTIQIQNVSACNVDQIQQDVYKLTWDVLFLSLLKIEFGKSMKPIAQLTNVEEFHLKWHQCVGVIFPQGHWVRQEVLRQKDARSPAERKQVEGAQLARLIELAVFCFGEVLFLVNFIQHIFLDYCMHNNGHKHVEEDGGQVFDAMLEMINRRLLWAFICCYGDIMLDSYEAHSKL